MWLPAARIPEVLSESRWFCSPFTYPFLGAVWSQNLALAFMHPTQGSQCPPASAYVSATFLHPHSVFYIQRSFHSLKGVTVFFLQIPQYMQVTGRQRLQRVTSASWSRAERLGEREHWRRDHSSTGQGETQNLTF